MTNEASPLSHEDSIVISHGSVTINGHSIEYTASTGTIVLKEEDTENKDGPKAKAHMFFVAYTRNDVSEHQSRPITFAFNGGPGSASVWLHLGVLGPRRVEMDADGRPLPPPFRLVENAFSLLDVTDLVFIDPISTGYSRPVAGEKDQQFHQFTKDIESVGEFIRLYTSRTGRWTSPKFLAGESYGTTRAAALADYLQQRHGFYFNGLMLISSVLDFQTLSFDPGNDLPYILYLPSFTATAWYHGCLAEDLQENLQMALAESEQFAQTEYALALLRGDALESDTAGAIAEALQRYTGLSLEYIRRSNLRIEIMRFTKELLRHKHRTVGRLDSRFVGIDRDAAGEEFEFDPSYTAIQGPYTATFNDYVRRDLKFDHDLPYEILNSRIWSGWSYDQHQNKYANVTEQLRKAMTHNPHLRVLVASGYYDLATPYLATNYTFNHLGLDAELRANITLTYYESGHMMYIQHASLRRLRDDLVRFIERSRGV